jgi:hypothetical protein
MSYVLSKLTKRYAKLGRNCCLESGLHSHIWTLGTNASIAPNIWTLGTISLFGGGTKSAPINSENLMTELNGPHFSEFGRLQI